MKCKIEKALPGDHEILTAISHRSKRYWNYPEEHMLLWTDELTILPEYIFEHRVFKLLVGKKIIGFCAIEDKRDHCEITHFWIEPEYIGRGFGRKLLQFVMQKVISAEVKVSVVADRKAEGFYSRHGFVKIDEVSGKIKNRWLPFMVNYNLGQVEEEGL